MTPQDLIAEFRDAVYDNGDQRNILKLIQDTLLDGLKDFPASDDLLLEAAIAYDTLVDEAETALSYYAKVKNVSRTDYLVNYARCLARTGDSDQALVLLDSAAVPPPAEVAEMRKDILEGLWDE
mgnify:CR=1 FL=1